MAARRRFRWGFAVLGAVLVVLLALVWVLTHQPPKQQHPPGVPVTVARAALADVPVSDRRPRRGAGLAGRADQPPGQRQLPACARRATDVRAGALLAQIDSGPYRAALTQAQGALKRDQAMLAGARADLARFQTLVAPRTRSPASRSTTRRRWSSRTRARSARPRRTVAAAQVNVRYCRIASPVDGRVGVRLVDPGNMVSTSDRPRASSASTRSSRSR